MTKTEAFQNSTLFMGLTTKNGYKVHKLYSIKASDGDGDFHWDRASTAYRMNQEGVLEEMVNNFPRVDYTNTCPELLIEKQSTNLLHRSQEFDNAAWTKDNSSITANDTLAPDDTLTADKIIEDTNNSPHGIFQLPFTTSNGSYYTFSIYVKPDTRTKIRITYGALVNFNAFGDDVKASIDVTNKSIISSTENPIVRFYDAPNGFTKITFTKQAIGVGQFNMIFSLVDASNNATYTGDGTSGLWIWGAQLEESDYATSYIPTTSASVTRVKDVAYNTTTDYSAGIGTMFVRCRIQDSVQSKIDVIASINDGSDEAYITMYTDEDNNLTISTYNNPDQNDYTYALGANGIYNIAVGYDLTLGKVNIAVNGVLKRANATTTNAIPVGLTRFELGSIYNGISPQIDNRVIGVMWFDTQLSDTDIVNITA